MGGASGVDLIGKEPKLDEVVIGLGLPECHLLGAHPASIAASSGSRSRKLPTLVTTHKNSQDQPFPSAHPDDAAARSISPRGRAMGQTYESTGWSFGEAAEQGEGSTVDVYQVLTERYHPIITGIRRMPKPVVAAVNGPAVGIGLSLALACDLVVAAESAYFALAFVNIGLAPDGGSSLFVPSRVGFARAAELAMLGERLDARKALDWGLINRVWPDAEFASNVAALLAQLASGPTKSYWGTKRQLDRWIYEQMEDQLEFEAGDPTGDRRSRAISPKGSRRSPKSGRPGSPAPEPTRPRAS